MKLAISADWHFDLHSRFGVSTEYGTSRLPDYQAAWAWAVGSAVDAGCSAFLVLGDFFNDRTSLDVLLVDALLQMVRESASKIPIIFLVGNHDTALRSAERSSLEIFSDTPGVSVIKKPTVWEGVGFLPWNDSLEVLKAGVDKLLRKGAAYLMGHALIAGAVPQGGVPPDVFSFGKFRQSFFGDVHQPVAIAPHTRYVGVPLHHNFGDVGTVPGILVLDTGTGAYEEISNPVSPWFCVIKTSAEVRKLRKTLGDHPLVVRWEGDEEEWEKSRELLASSRVEKQPVVELGSVRMEIRAQDQFPELWKNYLEFKCVEDDIRSEVWSRGVDVWKKYAV